jgi:hypothetical protein
VPSKTNPGGLFCSYPKQKTFSRKIGRTFLGTLADG